MDIYLERQSERGARKEGDGRKAQKGIERERERKEREERRDGR